MKMEQRDRYHRQQQRENFHRNGIQRKDASIHAGSDITVELTRRREFTNASPDESSYETRSRRSRPTICCAAAADGSRALCFIPARGELDSFEVFRAPNPQAASDFDGTHKTTRPNNGNHYW